MSSLGADTRFGLESLEPRILLSADPSGIGVSDAPPVAGTADSVGTEEAAAWEENDASTDAPSTYDPADQLEDIFGFEEAVADSGPEPDLGGENVHFGDGQDGELGQVARDAAPVAEARVEPGPEALTLGEEAFQSTEVNVAHPEAAQLVETLAAAQGPPHAAVTGQNAEEFSGSGGETGTGTGGSGAHDTALLNSLRAYLRPYGQAPETISEWLRAFDNPEVLGQDLALIGESFLEYFNPQPFVDGLLAQLPNQNFASLTDLENALNGVDGISVLATRDMVDNLELDLKITGVATLEGLVSPPSINLQFDAEAASIPLTLDFTMTVGSYWDAGTLKAVFYLAETGFQFEAGSNFSLTDLGTEALLGFVDIDVSASSAALDATLLVELNDPGVGIEDDGRLTATEMFGNSITSQTTTTVLATGTPSLSLTFTSTLIPGPATLTMTWPDVSDAANPTSNLGSLGAYGGLAAATMESVDLGLTAITGWFENLNEAIWLGRSFPIVGNQFTDALDLSGFLESRLVDRNLVEGMAPLATSAETLLERLQAMEGLGEVTMTLVNANELRYDVVVDDHYEVPVTLVPGTLEFDLKLDTPKMLNIGLFGSLSFSLEFSSNTIVLNSDGNEPFFNFSGALHEPQTSTGGFFSTGRVGFISIEASQTRVSFSLTGSAVFNDTDGQFSAADLAGGQVVMGNTLTLDLTGGAEASMTIDVPLLGSPTRIYTADWPDMTDLTDVTANVEEFSDLISWQNVNASSFASGLDQLADFVDKMAAKSLGGTNPFYPVLPLVNQSLGALIDFDDYFAANLTGFTGLNNQVGNVLFPDFENSQQLLNLLRSSAKVGDSTATVTATAEDIRYTLHIDHVITRTLPLSLGIDSQIDLDFAETIVIRLDTDLDLVFGVSRAGGLFFIEETVQPQFTVTGSVHGTTDFDVNTELGFLGVSVVDGTAALPLVATLRLADNDLDDAIFIEPAFGFDVPPSANKITSNELQITSVATLVDLSGSASGSVALPLSATLGTFTPAGTLIATWADGFFPDQFVLDTSQVDTMLRFQNVDAADVLAGLLAVPGFLNALKGPGELGTPIPFLGSSVGGEVTLGGQLQGYLNSLASFSTAQQLRSALDARIPGSVNVLVDDGENDIQYQFAFQQNLASTFVAYSVDEVLSALGLGIQASGNVAVSGTAMASVRVGVSLDGGVGSADRFYIVKGLDSFASVSFRVNVTSLSGTGSLGMFNVAIQNGSAKVGTGPGLANHALIEVAFDGGADGRVNVTEMKINAAASMNSPGFTGEVDLVLPLRNSAVQVPNGENPRVELHWTNLGNPGSVSINPHDLDPFLALAPQYNKATAQAGINAILGLLSQFHATSEAGTKVPWIAEKASGLFDFVAESRKFFQSIDTSGSLSTQFQAAIDNAIAVGGLDMAEASVSTLPGHDHLAAEPSFRYEFVYNKTVTVTRNVIFGNGTIFTLDDAELTVTVTYNLRIEFGMNKLKGFFVQDGGVLGPELRVSVAIDENLGQHSGKFGLLAIGALGTDVFTDFNLNFDLTDPNNSGGTISTSEMKASFSSVVNPGLVGEAHLHMPFAGRLGGEQENPGFISGFHAHWRASQPSVFTYGEMNTDTGANVEDGFEPVRYLTGNFVNGLIRPVLEEIRKYNPLPEEVVEVLLTELPIIGKTVLEVLTDDAGFPDEFLLFFEIVQVINSIPLGEEIDLSPYLPGESAPSMPGTPSASGGSDQSDFENLLDNLEDKYDISMPLLRDPSGSIITMLMGRDVDIISWKPDQVRFEVELPEIRIPFFNYGIPVLADITAYVGVRGFAAFFVNVEIGLTTRGLTHDLDMDGEPDNELLNGFFFGDTRGSNGSLPDQFEIGVELGVEAFVQGAGRLLGFDIVKVTGGGGIVGTVGLDLADLEFDPESDFAIEGYRRIGQDQVGGDNRVHLDELDFLWTRFGPECTLTLGGKIEATLFIEAEVCLPLLGCWTVFEQEFRWTIADFTLPCEPVEGNLAEVQGNTLFMFEDTSGSYEDSRITINLRRDRQGDPTGVRITKALRDPTQDFLPEALFVFEDFTLAELAGVTIIKLDGTTGHDSFRIDPGITAIDLTRFDQTLTPNPLNIMTISIFARAGNDVVDWGELKAENSTLVNTIIQGFDGDDILLGTFAEDFILGGEGNDQLIGYASDDEIHGGPGNDIIGGGQGNDMLWGGQGADQVWGHEGDDYINGGGDGDQLFGGAGADEIDGEGGPDVISGAGGIDLIRDHDGDDKVSGGEENDFIFNGAGNDQISGDDGDDYILAGPGDSQFIGNNGNDLVVQEGDFDHALSDTTLSGQGSSELKKVERVHLNGGAGNNTFDVSGYTDVAILDGRGGDDTVEARRDTDFGLSDWNLSLASGGSFELISIENAFLRGQAGLVVLTLGDNLFDVTHWTGTATIEGGGGLDSILSANDADFTLTNTILTRSTGGTFFLNRVNRAILTGGLSNNTIDASAYTGQALLFGGEGNDTLIGGSGDDLIDGGLGTDTLIGNGGNDEMRGGGGAGDSLSGNGGDDLIYGSDDGPDMIDGGSGRDRIFGLGGNDTISGGGGDDIIDGGLGDDTISGDAGSDLILGGEDHDTQYGHSVSGAGDDDAVDFLYGDLGTNANETGSGRDRLFGQGGNDFLFGEGEDDFLDGGGGVSNFIYYGAGESGTPSDFVAPAGTPNPTVQSSTGIIFADPTLPDSEDYRGRWSEFAGSASGMGVSGDPALSIESSIAAGNGSLFVAWADNRTGTWEIYVAVHTAAAGWTQLSGSASNGGVSSSPFRQSRRPVVILDEAGQPLVAWTEIGLFSRDIYVAAYDPAADGGLGDWVALGGSLTSGGISGTGLADNARIVPTNTGPVVAWIDGSSGTNNVYAKRFNGSSWLGLGNGGGTGTGISQSNGGNVAELALATDGTKVAVAWTQPGGLDTGIYLRELSGSTWNQLSNSATGSGVSGGIGDINRHATLAYHEGDLYVAWQSDAHFDDRMEIYASHHNGSNWVSIGSGPVSARNGDHGRSMNQRTLPKLASGGGELHLAWMNDQVRDHTGNTTAIYATIWNGSAFVPEIAGDAAFKGVAPGAVPESLNLVVDELGHPFIGYRDAISGSPEVSVRGNQFDIGSVYYVNDNTSVGDEYTTAPGSVFNDGLTPSTPLPSIQAVLDAYDLNQGDVILVDAGLYENLLEAGGELAEFIYTITSDDDGVTIIGAPNVPSVLVSSLLLDGVSDVTLQGLTFAEGLTLTNTVDVTVRDSVITTIPDLSGALAGLTINGGFNPHIVHNVFSSSGSNLRLNATSTDAVVEYNQFILGSTAIRLNSGGAGNLTLRFNTIRNYAHGIRLQTAASGFIAGNDVAANNVALEILEPFTGLIEGNDFHGAGVGVDHRAAAALSANHIRSNTVGVASNLSGAVDGFGFAGGTLPNEIHHNGTGVELDGWMQNQHVYQNGTGVRGGGRLGGEDLDKANLIELNITGLVFSGTIQYNRIARNGIGIQAFSDQLIAHNLIYRNDTASILLKGVNDVQIFNNTLYAPEGDNIRIEGATIILQSNPVHLPSSNIEIRNNIMWAESGYNIYVDNRSQSGFFSDYNTLHTSGTGKLGFWTRDFIDILDWQADIATFDLHSIGHTVVNPVWSEPRFINKSLDNFEVFGLVAGQRFSSPTIDAGDALTDESHPLIMQNLLVNPSFEAGTLSGWTTNAQATTQSSVPSPFNGSSYFYAGGIALGFAEQTVDLINAGFTPAELDNQDLVAVFGGRVRSADEAILDRGTVQLIFLDAGDNPIGAPVKVDSTNPTDRWDLAGDRVHLPFGTRGVTFRFESALSTGNTSDSYVDNTFLYLVPDTVEPNQGAYGNTTKEVAENPAQHIALRSPDLYVDWERNRPRSILWDSYNNASESLVRIDLLRDDPVHGPQLLLNIAASTADDGLYIWTPQVDGIDFATYGLRIQITVLDNPTVTDRSTEPFTVPEDGTVYWVDDGGNVNDEYTPGATGDNRFTGKLATAPKPNPVNLLRVYELSGTSVLNIDTGVYPMIHNVVLSTNPLVGYGNDEGFLFTGPSNPARVAELTAANPHKTDRAMVELNDADFVTLRHLTISNVLHGVWAYNSSTNLDASFLTLTGHSSDGFRLESESFSTLFHDITASNNGGAGIYINAVIGGLHDSASFNNSGNGVTLLQTGDATIEGNEFFANLGNGAFVDNSVEGTRTVFGNLDLSLGRGNLVYNNVNFNFHGARQGVRIEGRVDFVGNSVYGHTNGFTGIAAFVGVDVFISRNLVYNNSLGISARGLITENRVYNNEGIGIESFNGAIFERNVVYDNDVGIYVSSGVQSIRNNLVYDNDTYGIHVRHGEMSVSPLAYTSVVNNTVYQVTGDALRVEGSSEHMRIRNNILGVASGVALSVAADSQLGFESDFNLFFITGSGKVASWQSLIRTDLVSWRNTALQDQNSLQRNPQFVDFNGADNILGYGGLAQDGSDDDFHLSSLNGSFHGGSLAPVRHAGTGLPVVAVAVVTNDGVSSPGIDRGGDTDSFVNEPFFNGNYINLGAYGNTAQASKSPEQYVLVTRPDGGESWPQDQTFTIQWRSHDLLGTVDIELMEQGNGTPILSIATGEANDGEYAWTIPQSVPPGTNYLVRVSRGVIVDTSDQVFNITQPITVYYVNDATVEAGDWTTAIGDDANDGLTAATPKATIASVLSTYTLGPGNVIRVDAGQYLVSANILLDASDNGYTIEGYNDPGFPGRHAVMDRANTSSSSYVFQFTGADDVTLDHLHLTGAYRGVFAASNANSDNIQITNNTIFNQSNTGIYFQASNDDWLVSGNTIRDLTVSFGTGIFTNGLRAYLVGNDIYNISQGINASLTGTVPREDRIVIEGNYVHHAVYNQTGNGIFGQFNTLVLNNTVFGFNVGFGYGIAISSNSEARGNVVHGNYDGILAGTLTSRVVGNEVFNNRNYGIRGDIVEGNRVYNNLVGISPSGIGAIVNNNLVYNNQDAGIEASGIASSSTVRVTIRNNTIYQPDGAGILLHSGGGIKIHNNIIWVESSYALEVRTSGTPDSNYNLFHTQGTGQVGRIENQDFSDLNDWFLARALDEQSRQADPLFVDVDGSDDVFGFSFDTTGPVMIVDDGDPDFELVGVSWFYSTAEGYNGDYQESSTTVETGRLARWTFENLLPGEYYQIAVTYPPDAGRFPATYNVYVDDVLVLNGIRADQRSNVDFDFFDEGVNWAILGILPVGAEKITVELLAASTNGRPIAADAVRVQRLEGRHGVDDDFHLLTGSLGIDTGDPLSYYLSEQPFNGGRVNMGAYGNTIESAISPNPLVQVLTPNGLEVYEEGALVPITWTSAGLTLNHTVARINVGGESTGGTYGNWLPSADYARGFYSITGDAAPVDLTGVVNPAPEAVYQRTFLASSGVGNGFGFDIPVPAGEYTVWLHFADSVTSAGQRVFDILLQDQVEFAGYDIFVDAGGRHKATTESFDVTVNGAEGISLDIVNVVSRARLMGIEITAVNPQGTADPAVNVDLSTDNGATWTSIATGVALDAEGKGSLDWTAGPQTIGNTALIRVTNGNPLMGGFAQDVSDDGFTITNGGVHYYVNDGITVGDVFTTAVGNDINDGKDPSRPKATLTNLLDSYDLEPGDIVHVDTGTYIPPGNILLTEDDSGVTIEGPSNGVALFDRGAIGTDRAVFQIAGAHNVTIDQLTITGGSYGVWSSNADGDFLTISNNRILGRHLASISLGFMNEDALIAGNHVEHASSSLGEQNTIGISVAGARSVVTGNFVSGYESGILAALTSSSVPMASRILVTDNVVRANGTGIYARGLILVENNEASSNGTGILADFTRALVLDNEVFFNAVGLAGGPALGQGNVSYGNTSIGLRPSGSGAWNGNTIYDNPVGIELDGFGSFYEISNNLVYNSYDTGVIINEHTVAFLNNTVHQVNGNAVEFGTSVQVLDFRNNIITAQSGYALFVDERAQRDFQADYNLYHLTGSAKLARWGADDILTLKDWFFEVGQGRHSQFGNPLFVNPAGGNGFPGFSSASVGSASFLDNDSPFGFSTTGTWSVESGGYNGSFVEKTTGTGSVTWTFTGLTPGATYNVAATWDPGFQRSTVTYRVVDGNVLAAARQIDIRNAPDDFSDAGVPWETIGMVRATTTTLTVTFEASGNQSADAVRLQEIRGDLGGDDSFHLSPASPGVDQADPNTYYLGEPWPNGGRANLGAYGNTAGAALSPAQTIQVLSPNGWEKYEIGQQIQLEWLSSGLLSSQVIGLINVGGEPIGPWLEDRYAVSSNSPGDSTFPNLNLSGVVNPAPSDVYRNYVSLFDGGNLVYELPVADGSYQIRIHFISNTTLASRQVFDVSVQDQLVLNDFDLWTVAPTLETAAALSFSATVSGGGGLKLQLDHALSNFSTSVAALEIFRVNPNGYVVESADLAISTDLGATWSTVASNVTTDRFGRGSFAWTVDRQTSGNTTLFRATSVQSPTVTDRSDRAFTLANNGTLYYVNDAFSGTDIFTTVAGDNFFDGKTPGTPMANLAALVAAYDLDAGDIVNVDGGMYRLLRDVLLLEEDSGVRVQGLPIAAPSILNRVNHLVSHEVFEIRGAENVILRDLQITGGEIGVLAEDPDAFHTGLSIQNNEFVGNELRAIRIDDSYITVSITGNIIRDTLGFATGIEAISSVQDGFIAITDNRIFGHVYGIYVEWRNGLIDGNEVYGNSNTGIYVRGNTFPEPTMVVSNNIVRNNGTTSNGYGIDAMALVTNNLVHDHGLVNGRGINLQLSGVARDNTVFNNYYGIYTNGGTVDGNRVYNNSQAGIYLVRTASINANYVYSNSVGLWLQNNTASSSLVTNNLIYDNTNQGILINMAFGSTTAPVIISQNTIYQPVGDAVRIENNTRAVTVRNNIMWVLAGFNVYVASNSQTLKDVDYNILFQSNDPNAHIGFWNNAIQDALTDWQTASGLDANSLDLDPLFVDLDGADNILGYDSSEDGFDGGPDDNFYRHRNSPATDSGDPWTGTSRDIEGFGRIDDVGVANTGRLEYFGIPGADTVYDGNGLPLVVGTPQNLFSDNSSTIVNLGFDFTFFDVNYTSVRAYVDGYLIFATTGINGQLGTELETARARVLAPMWDDLNTLGAGDNLFVDTSVPNAVTIRWDASHGADGSDVHFAVTLRDDGTFSYHYGAGNTNLTPQAGFAHGNGLHAKTIPTHDGMSVLTNAASLDFDLAPGISDIGAYEFRGSSLDTTPPGVSQTFFTVVEGTNGTVSQIQVTFTEVLNTIDANAPANYELRDDGGNGIFGDGGDTIFELIPYYAAGTTTVLLDVVVPGGGLLPVGKYQLSVSGDTTIHDLSGLALDGDNDGQPGGNFVLDNQSPALGAISDRVVTAGNLLSFTVTATDGDVPQQALTFSLGAGAPLGASIDPVTGLFTWQTSAGDLQAEYQITVVVTDDGVPALTDSRTFTVLVNQPPAVVEVRVNGGQTQRSRVEQIELVFSDDVSASLTIDDLVLTNLDLDLAIDAADMLLDFDDGNLTATLTFPGLAGGRLTEGNYRITILAGGVVDPQGLVLGVDVDLNLHVLRGDANGDRVTNDLDLYLVWRDLRRPELERNLNQDLNGDGIVDSGDLNEVTSNYLASLAPPSMLAGLTEDDAGTKESLGTAGGEMAESVTASVNEVSPAGHGAEGVPAAPIGMLFANDRFQAMGFWIQRGQVGSGWKAAAISVPDWYGTHAASRSGHQSPWDPEERNPIITRWDDFMAGELSLLARPALRLHDVSSLPPLAQTRIQ